MRLLLVEPGGEGVDSGVLRHTDEGRREANGRVFRKVGVHHGLCAPRLRVAVGDRWALAIQPGEAAGTVHRAALRSGEHLGVFLLCSARYFCIVALVCQHSSLRLCGLPPIKPVTPLGRHRRR